MSADKYQSIFSRQMATIVYIFPNFQNCARCEKDLKDNKDNSRHLGRNYASPSENCELRGTDNVQGQISEHIFAPNGDYCLYNTFFQQSLKNC